MAFDIAATIDAIESQLSSSGQFDTVTQGRPASIPGADLYTAAILMDRVEVAETTLTKTIEQHVVTVRLYRDPTASPTATVEEDLAARASGVMADLAGDLDLAATVRNVDPGGQYGQRLTNVDGRRLGAVWGYETVGGTEFRIVDVTVPLVVESNATLAA